MKPLPVETNSIPRDVLLPLKGKRVLITGSSGFVGRWMLESLICANVGANVTALTRKPRAGSFEIEGDTNVYPIFGDDEEFDYIIHCSPVGARNMTFHLADGGRMLLLSSGAVYGSLEYPSEDDVGVNVSDYGKMKLEEERDCKDKAIICRLFSFIGPGLRRHIGKEFLEVNPIWVKLDGAVRSWLYASDLTEWLWKALLNGVIGRAYNIGSLMPYTVFDLAEKCSSIRGTLMVLNSICPFDGTYYVPTISRAQRELGVIQRVSLNESIRKTLEWNAR
jgi:nucleoside-diphosphate-sugar epimerase